MIVTMVYPDLRQVSLPVMIMACLFFLLGSCPESARVGSRHGGKAGVRCPSFVRVKRNSPKVIHSGIKKHKPTLVSQISRHAPEPQPKELFPEAVNP